MAEDVAQRFESGEYDQVRIAYTKFLSVGVIQGKGRGWGWEDHLG